MRRGDRSNGGEGSASINGLHPGRRMRTDELVKPKAIDVGDVNSPDGITSTQSASPGSVQWRRGPRDAAPGPARLRHDRRRGARRNGSTGVRRAGASPDDRGVDSLQRDPGQAPAAARSLAERPLVHLPRTGGDPRELIKFFPGLLFGWMRSSTGSILAGTLTHGSAISWSASSNSPASDDRRVLRQGRHLLQIDTGTSCTSFLSERRASRIGARTL